MLPRIIDALLTTHLVAAKVVDGIARTLTKSDIASLTHNTKQNMWISAPSHLEEAQHLCEALQALPHNVDNDDITKELGLLTHRIGAHLCSSGELTFEAEDYDSMAEIVAMCSKGVFDVLSKCGATIGDLKHEVSESWIKILQSSTALPAALP